MRPSQALSGYLFVAVGIAAIGAVAIGSHLVGAWSAPVPPPAATASATVSAPPALGALPAPQDLPLPGLSSTAAAGAVPAAPPAPAVASSPGTVPVAAAASPLPAPAAAAAPSCLAGYSLLPLSFAICGTVSGSSAADLSTGLMCPAQGAACMAAVAQGACADATTQAPTLEALTAALQACLAGGAPAAVAPAPSGAPVMPPASLSAAPAGPTAKLSASTADASPAVLSPAAAGGCAIVGGQPCWQAATYTWWCPNEVDGTEHVCGAAELHTLQSGLPWAVKVQDCLSGMGCEFGTKHTG